MPLRRAMVVMGWMLVAPPAFATERVVLVTDQELADRRLYLSLSRDPVTPAAGRFADGTKCKVPVAKLASPQDGRTHAIDLRDDCRPAPGRDLAVDLSFSAGPIDTVVLKTTSTVTWPPAPTSTATASTATASTSTVSTSTTSGSTTSGTGAEDADYTCANFVLQAKAKAEERYGATPEQAVYVCFDDSTRVVDVALAPRIRRHVLAPNTPLVVVVRHPQQWSGEVEFSGTRGLYTTTDRVALPTTQDDGLAGGGTLTAPADPGIVSVHLFGPRLPGSADLGLVFEHASGDSAKRKEITVPFEVEATYAGAVRLGLAAVGGGAVDGTYAPVTMPGSLQAEIGVTEGGPLDTELVLGYSVYLRRNGRGLATAKYPWCFDLYGGIGLIELDVGQDRFQALKSMYLGPEWEPTPQFSLALTIVARRVTRLQDGLEPGVSLGDPAAAGDIPTRTGFGVGGALVVNFSPAFFQVARKSTAEIVGY